MEGVKTVYSGIQKDLAKLHHSTILLYLYFTDVLSLASFEGYDSYFSISSFPNQVRISLPRSWNPLPSLPYSSSPPFPTHSLPFSLYIYLRVQESDSEKSG